MGRPMLYDVPALAGRLYDELAGNEAGLTKVEIGALLEVPEHVASRVLHYLRNTLGGEHAIAVPYRRGQEARKGRERRYFLTDNGKDLEYRDRIRLRTSLTQARTEVAMWTVTVNSSDGRTAVGRANRAALKSWTRLAEDLADQYTLAYGEPLAPAQ